MPYFQIIIGLVLAQFIYFGVMVGRARGLYGVAAPATSGHDLFDRHFRVQMNTLELLVAFLPGMYGFAYYFSPLYAAALGAVFFVGRFLYASAYIKDSKSRTVGFALSILPIVVLIGGTILGGVLELAHQHGG